MPAPATSDDFLDLLRKTDVVELTVLDAYLEQLRAAGPIPPEPRNLAGLMVRDGVLTHFQAGLFLLGRTTGFTIGKYRILERLGTGGMGSVFLCEDTALRRRIAVKVLPRSVAKDPASLARFHREAHVTGVLDHPNIVHALDFCQDGDLFYLVMEFIDGVSFQEMVDKSGPMEIDRAAHYIKQTAEGLQHAHLNGLVHRDIKPGNILVDRTGVVKILDMGLARFTDSRNEAITTRFDDQSVMGTADYLAPEQALSLNEVDTRADLYSLGMTFYFLLSGHPPFKEGAIPQKLLWHQMKDPTPIREIRPEVSEELAEVLAKMIRKDPAQRYQTPGEVVEALAPWTQIAIEPPPEIEMRRLSLAALGGGPTTGTLNGPPTLRGTTSSWILPEGTPGPATMRPPIAPSPSKPGFDTPHPSAQQTEFDLKPVEESNGKKSSPNHRASIGVQERLSDSSSGSQLKKRPKEDEDVELVEEETTASGTKLRRGEKGKRKDDAPSSKKLHGHKRRKKGAGAAGGIDLRIWIPVAAGVLVLLLAVGGFVIYKVTRPAKLPDDNNVNNNDNNKRPPGPRQPETLFVTKDGKPNTFPTIQAAYLHAIPGDLIMVQLDTVEEALTIRGEGGHGKNITLQGAGPSAKPVLWKAPVNLPEGDPILELSEVSGLKLKGFRFDGQIDGQKRLNTLIVITGRCPDTNLEDIHCGNFRQSAVKFKQCTGEQKDPVTVVRLRATTAGAKDVESLLSFEATGEFINQHIQVRDCRFEGPCKSAVHIAGPVNEVLFERNRFHQTTEGILYKKPDAPQRFHVTVKNNTFANLQRGLSLEAIPLNDKANRLVIENNLFQQVAKLASVAGVPTEPATSPAQFIWFDEGAPETPAETRYFRRTFDVVAAPSSATLNITADDSFAVWVNGAEVFNSPHQHFTKRVYSVPVGKHLNVGKNILAVQATNANDFTGKPTNAALLVQLAYTTSGKTMPVNSDKNWKASKSGPNGWQALNFDDKQWSPVRVIGGFKSKEALPWSGLLWDTTSRNYFVKSMPPLIPVAKGNVRDHLSGEGYPPLDAQGGEFKLDTARGKDAGFLRYDKNSPLTKVGSPGMPP